MGHMIEKTALERGHEVVCIIEPSAVSGQPSESKIYSPEEGFTSEAFKSANVAIEFTTPATAEANIRKAWAAGVPVVCGTTGWEMPKNWKGLGYGDYRVRYDSETNMPVLWDSNFSIGVLVFNVLNYDLRDLLLEYPQYKPSIKEIHHIHKLDKPSGTAKHLAEHLGENIPIESVREGEVPGTHIVTWDSPDDTIIVTHIAKGRGGFALGAVIAAEKLAETFKGWLENNGYK